MTFGSVVFTMYVQAQVRAGIYSAQYLHIFVALQFYLNLYLFIWRFLNFTEHSCKTSDKWKFELLQYD